MCSKTGMVVVKGNYGLEVAAPEGLRFEYATEHSGYLLNSIGGVTVGFYFLRNTEIHVPNS